MSDLKLGKTPARPGAVKFAFSDFFHAPNLPPVPDGPFGHYGLGEGLKWGELGNNKWGDCVWAGAGHEHMLWTHHSGAGEPIAFSTENILQAYHDCTGFNYTVLTDWGTDMQEAAEFRRTKGIKDAAGNIHKVDAYLMLQRGNVDQMLKAMYWLGAIGIGIQVPFTCQEQFKAHEPWQYIKWSNVLGGHYIPGVGRNSDGDILCVTWGRLHAGKQSFWERYVDEAIAYVSFDYLDKRGYSPEGFDKAGLQQALTALRS